ncbi:MAG TPA: alkaline phosphatase family protein [Polyangiaceae bacterium]|nr:alkaline phosphatase family protein [Polyangiaceae bacterium]
MLSFGSGWYGLPSVLALSVLAVACSKDEDHGKPPPSGDGGGSDAGGTACGLSATLVEQRSNCKFTAGALPEDTLGSCATAKNPIEHVIVLMQENRSFDQYYGHLKGHGQDDVDVPPESTSNPGSPADGGTGAVIPWHHEPQYCVTDTDHGWPASHRQYDDGKNDGFALSNSVASDPTGSRAMGYYDQTDIPFYYDLASTFAMSDRYFCSVLGPTYPNRMYLMGGTSFGIVTTDLNTLAPPGANQIFKALNDKNVDWKDYHESIASGLLYPDFATDSAQAAHFVDISEFAKDAAAGTLPPFALIDPNFSSANIVQEDDEHPPSDIQMGQKFVYDQVQALMHSPEWKSSVLFITYDEHGGLYDHVAPPAACAPDDTPPRLNPELGNFDRLGFRVPLIVVSPYAKRHFVSHVVHSHTSILRFIEAKFGIGALTNRDANSDAMFDLLDFESPPNLDVPSFTEPAVSDAQAGTCAQNF